MDDPGDTGEEFPVIPEIRTQQLGNAEDELPVGQLQENIPVQVLRQEQDPLLVATRAQVPGFTGKRAEVLMLAVRIEKRAIVFSKQDVKQDISHLQIIFNHLHLLQKKTPAGPFSIRQMRVKRYPP